MDYAPDGNVSRFSSQQIGRACDTDGARFMDAMVTAGFVDSAPYLRLHDWWDYSGEFLRGRLAGKPEQLKAIKDSYSVVTPELPRSAGDVNAPQIRVDKKEEKEKQEKKDKGERIRFAPPTIKEVQDYIASASYPVSAERFVSYYESNGWRVGRNPMKDWKAAVRTWATKANNDGYSKPQEGKYGRIAEDI